MCQECVGGADPAGGTAGSGDPSGPYLRLSPDEAAVLALFDDPRPIHVDRLAERATFGMARLQTSRCSVSPSAVVLIRWRVGTMLPALENGSH